MSTEDLKARLAVLFMVARGVPEGCRPSTTDRRRAREALALLRDIEGERIEDGICGVCGDDGKTAMIPACRECSERGGNSWPVTNDGGDDE